MEYKSMIIVHEPPVEFVAGGGGTWEGEVTAYCGSKKGQTSLKVQFDKNVFYNNEVAQASIIVDNSKCELNITEVEFEIQQKLNLKTGENIWDHSKCFTFEVLENKNHTPIKAGEKTPFTWLGQLNLGAIQYYPKPMKKKKRGFFSNGAKEVPRSPEEMFMLSRLAPACHSKLVRNEYYLNVNVKYDDCCAGCCGELPHVSMPLTIIPLVDPNHLVEPPDYAPVELGSFQLDISQATK